MPYKQHPLDAIAAPLVKALSRPKFMRFNQLVLEFAYRLNGFGVWYDSADGLPHGEMTAITGLVRKLSPETVFDVGANVGNFAVLVRRLQPDSRIICFEPQPRTAERLEGRSEELNLTVERLALSSESGTAKFYEQKGAISSTIASLSKEGVQDYSGDVEEFDVDVSTVDQYCKLNNIKNIDLLKIDAEGFDYDVLCGATEMLKGDKVKAITFEIVPFCINNHVFFRDIFDLLPSFRVFRILATGKLYEIEKYQHKYCEIFVPSSYVAVHRNVAVR